MGDADALHWLTSRCDFTCPPGKLEVDAHVIARGPSREVGLYAGGRAPLVDIDALREHAIIDGDIIVDGALELHGGACFIFGNVACRSLFNAEGYLVIAGSLVCDRYLGLEETGTTIVMGDAAVTHAVSFFQHGFAEVAVWGQARMDHIVDGFHGRERAHQRLAEWGLDAKAPVDWARARHQLRHWASSEPPIADAERPSAFHPRLVSERRPQRTRASDTIEAFEGWLKDKTQPQRHKLAVIEADWLPRFADDDRADARRLIEKHISSRFGAAIDDILKTLT